MARALILFFTLVMFSGWSNAIVSPIVQLGVDTVHTVVDGIERIKYAPLDFIGSLFGKPFFGSPGSNGLFILGSHPHLPLPFGIGGSLGGSASGGLLADLFTSGLFGGFGNLLGGLGNLFGLNIAGSGAAGGARGLGGRGSVSVDVGGRSAGGGLLSGGLLGGLGKGNLLGFLTPPIAIPFLG